MQAIPSNLFINCWFLTCQYIIFMVRKPFIGLGLNMPARAEHTTRSELMPTLNGKIHDVILYFGIIDVLQDYDITKKLEHAYKSLQVDPNSISAVDPKLYSRRFQEFIRRIFMEDDWPNRDRGRTWTDFRSQNHHGRNMTLCYWLNMCC